jgi:hypothetical protein
MQDQLNEFSKKHDNRCIVYYFKKPDLIRMGNSVFVFNKNRTFSINFPYSPARVRIVNHSSGMIKVRHSNKEEQEVNKDFIYKLDRWELVNLDLPEWLNLNMVEWLVEYAFEITAINATNNNFNKIDYDLAYRDFNLQFTVNTMKVKREEVIYYIKNII